MIKKNRQSVCPVKRLSVKQPIRGNVHLMKVFSAKFNRFDFFYAWIGIGEKKYYKIFRIETYNRWK